MFKDIVDGILDGLGCLGYLILIIFSPVILAGALIYFPVYFILSGGGEANDSTSETVSLVITVLGLIAIAITIIIRLI